MCPYSSQVGNEVWLFKGARLFYVLRGEEVGRPVQELISESYLHRFMEGEGVAGRELDLDVGFDQIEHEHQQSNCGNVHTHFKLRGCCPQNVFFPNFFATSPPLWILVSSVVIFARMDFRIELAEAILFTLSLSVDSKL